MAMISPPLKVLQALSLPINKGAKQEIREVKLDTKNIEIKKEKKWEFEMSEVKLLLARR